MQYSILKKRQLAEIREIPVFYAFDEYQFNNGLRKWGAKIDEVSMTEDIDTFIWKKDKQKREDFLARHTRERQQLIDADKTGMGFIQDMFLTELLAYQYEKHLDPMPALKYLEITPDEISNNAVLNTGFQSAIKNCCQKMVKIIRAGYLGMEIRA